MLSAYSVLGCVLGTSHSPQRAHFLLGKMDDHNQWDQCFKNHWLRFLVVYTINHTGLSRRRESGSMLHSIKSQCQHRQPKYPSISGEFSSENITIVPSVSWHLHEVLVVKNSSTDVPQTPRHPHHRCFPADLIYLHTAISAHNFLSPPHLIGNTFIKDPGYRWDLCGVWKTLP